MLIFWVSKIIGKDYKTLSSEICLKTALTSGDVSSSWIPLHIGCHEVFSGLHDRHLVSSRVNKIQNSAHTPQPSKYDKLSIRAPEQVVCLTLVQGF